MKTALLSVIELDMTGVRSCYGQRPLWDRLKCSIDNRFSIRARKCMIRMGITTFGELIRHSSDELLKCRNFGISTLAEVRDKLTEYGLSLRDE